VKITFDSADLSINFSLICINFGLHVTALCDDLLLAFDTANYVRT
jgi:hypothetical protein